ncbi:rhodanese-like domain-containing protein [Erythrobacter tepidarius]|uniref:rhodanese-like domain-containing protein n=1 Tax=Erythrobacter tepidarius TaxID=60454 RepID=UPI001FEC797A|nr:rhodanese-like domain-containing protein [Erythrobacter tepidarius]
MRAAGILVAAAALMVMAQAPAPTDAALFDAAGFRSARYRAPVKADPAPAQTITLAAALALDPAHDALFIDVMPAEGGVRDPVSGVWSLSQPHLTIPGAVWLPETGRAPVDEDLWAALEARIATARAAAPDTPVILFCRSDCWMSWNAARRLALRGIGNVHWLPEGTDGWHAAGRALVAAVPIPVPASTITRQEN